VGNPKRHARESGYPDALLFLDSGHASPRKDSVAIWKRSRVISSDRVCGNCHFDAKRRNLVFYVAENSRSLTAFEMTNQREHEFSHSLAFEMTNQRKREFSHTLTKARDLVFSATYKEIISRPRLEMTIATPSLKTGEHASLPGME
jgi:hypothetical protein